MNEIRVGMVGAGYIAGAHSAAYRAAAGTFLDGRRRLQLTRVADVDESRAQAVAREWGWEASTGDWKAITRSDDVDLISVAVPNVFHAEIACDALAHGKHVICEKPMSDGLIGATQMHAAATSSGRLAQVCFYYRLWPAIAWAGALVAGGRIGEVTHLRCWMLQDYAANPSTVLGWRAEGAPAGAGALGDLGSHVIDIARFFCGEIAEVTCRTRNDLRGLESQVDDLATALLNFRSGATGVLEASWALRGHQCDLGFDLAGTDGAIRFSWERANEIEVLFGNTDNPENGFRRILVGRSQPFAEPFAGVPGQGLGYRDAFTIGVGQMLLAITDGQPTVTPSFEDGLRAAEVVEACLRSVGSQASELVSQP